MNTVLQVVGGRATAPVKTAFRAYTRPKLQPQAKTRSSAPRQPLFRPSGPLKPDSASLSDAIRLAQLGDAAAFETIYQLHSRRVYALCLRMTGDPAEAEDLTQEAFLQLFRKIHTFRGESAFSTWLHRMAANLVLMRLRRRAPSQVPLECSAELSEANGQSFREIRSADLALNGSIDRICLERAVAQLPACYKLVFELHDVQGYKHTEIAQMMECS